MVTAAQLMRTKLARVDDSVQMGIVEAEMRIADVRHVIVTDAHGRLAGIVSRGDLLRATSGNVAANMTRRVYSVRADAPAARAVDLMITHGIGAVPVLDDDERPVGVLTETDFLQIAREALNK
jgi:CBS domain-containing protein